MKIALTVLSMLLANSAFAYPAVGDHVYFEGTSYYDRPETLEIYNVSENGKFLVYSVFDEFYDTHNPAWNCIKGCKTWNQTREEASDTSMIDNKTVPTPKAVERILTNCRDLGGYPEVITVPAGKFNTCRLTTHKEFQTQHDGAVVWGWTRWVGDVPFGYVKTIDTYYYLDGKTPDMVSMLELQKIESGN